MVRTLSIWIFLIANTIYSTLILCCSLEFFNEIVFLLDRAREEFSNSSGLTAVSIENGINATRSHGEINLTFYLSIYSGEPFIPVALAAVFSYCNIALLCL